MRRSTGALAPLLTPGRVSGRLARRGFWPLVFVQGALWAGAIWADLWPLALAAVALIWPLIAAMVRRLHDTGRHGWWVLLLLVPLGALPLAWMLMQRPSVRPTIYDRGRDVPERAALVALFGLALSALALLALPVQVTRAGMKPGLLSGDIALVWRLGAGGITRDSCWPMACPRDAAQGPALGSVVAFAGPDHRPHLGRVMARAGDVIEVEGTQIRLNGAALPTQLIGHFDEAFGPQGPAHSLPRCRNGAVGLGAPCRKSASAQSLPNGRRFVVLDSGPTQLDAPQMFTVPPGHAFVLADNRDTGQDSRIATTAGGVGFVPYSSMIGRVARVLVSFRGAGPWAVWTWRPTRVMEPVL